MVHGYKKKYENEWKCYPRYGWLVRHACVGCAFATNLTRGVKYCMYNTVTNMKYTNALLKVDVYIIM